MMKATLLLLVVTLGGCTTTTNTVQLRQAACPELPLLRQGATADEVQKHHRTVIEMYAHCAKDKQ